MAMKTFIGVHVGGSGQPSDFRTITGKFFPAGAGRITALFSRKDETANLDMVRAQHAAAVAGFTVERNVSAHITNNTPHIASLNDGWSAQTDAGFFERALQVAKKAVIGSWRLKEAA